MIQTMLRPLCALILLPALLFSETLAPRFSDYPPIGVYRGQNAPVVINGQNREFRTRLREASHEKPNFAAHYIVTVWGCGSACLRGAILDANSGVVAFFPHSISGWPPEVEEPVVFHLDSRLILFIGERDENERDYGSHYYDFRDGKFVHVKSMTEYRTDK